MTNIKRAALPRPPLASPRLSEVKIRERLEKALAATGRLPTLRALHVDVGGSFSRLSRIRGAFMRERGLEGSKEPAPATLEDLLLGPISAALSEVLLLLRQPVEINLDPLAHYTAEINASGMRHREIMKLLQELRSAAAKRPGRQAPESESEAGVAAQLKGLRDLIHPEVGVGPWTLVERHLGGKIDALGKAIAEIRPTMSSPEPGGGGASLPAESLKEPIQSLLRGVETIDGANIGAQLGRILNLLLPEDGVSPWIAIEQNLSRRVEHLAAKLERVTNATPVQPTTDVEALGFIVASAVKEAAGELRAVVQQQHLEIIQEIKRTYALRAPDVVAATEAQQMDWGPFHILVGRMEQALAKPPEFGVLLDRLGRMRYAQQRKTKDGTNEVLAAMAALTKVIGRKPRRKKPIKKAARTGREAKKAKKRPVENKARRNKLALTVGKKGAVQRNVQSHSRKHVVKSRRRGSK